MRGQAFFTNLRLPVLFLAALLSSACASKPEPAPAQDAPPAQDTQDAQARLAEIFTVLDDLMLTAEQENQVRQYYTRVRAAIQAGQIAVILGQPEDFPGAQILQSVYFTTDQALADEGRGMIVVNPAVLYIADSAIEPGAEPGSAAVSSLTLSLLMETIGYAGSFLALGPSFLEQSEDTVERYLLSMDALYLQALFVQQFLAGSFELSPYDRYLVETLQVDGLSSVSMYFRGVDQDMVIALIQQTQAAREGDLAFDRYLEQVASLLSLLVDRYQASFEEAGQLDELGTRARYISTVSVGSYLKYGVPVINEFLAEKQDLIRSSEALRGAVEAINQDSRHLYTRFVELNWDLQAFRGQFQEEFFGQR